MKKRSSAEKSAWIGFAGLLIAAIIVGVFTLLSKDNKADISVNGSKNVVSQGQSGRVRGQIYQNITQNINITNPPHITEVKMVPKNVVFINKQEGNRYHSRLQLKLIYQVPPTNIYLAVYEENVQEIALAPMRTGMSISGHSGRKKGYAFTNLQTPYPELQLDIFSTKPISLSPEKFRIEYDIT